MSSILMHSVVHWNNIRANYISEKAKVGYKDIISTPHNSHRVFDKHSEECAPDQTPLPQYPFFSEIGRQGEDLWFTPDESASWIYILAEGDSSMNRMVPHWSLVRSRWSLHHANWILLCAKEIEQIFLQNRSYCKEPSVMILARRYGSFMILPRLFLYGSSVLKLFP